MDYIFLLIAAILNGFTAILCKLYQDKYIDRISSLFMRTFIVAIFGLIFMFLLAKFKLEFSIRSFLIAFLMGFVSSINASFQIASTKYGEVSISQSFSMIGGMLLPYLYGLVFLKENPSMFCIIGLILIIIGLAFFTIDKGMEKTKNAKLFLLCVIVVFILNGFISIMQKMSRIGDGIIEPFSFTFYQYISLFLFTGLFTFVFKLKNKDENLIKISNKYSIVKAVIICLLITLISSLAFIMQLKSASNLDATVVYPIVFGGTIVITALLSIILCKEKISIKKWISLLVILIGTILFLF